MEIMLNHFKYISIAATLIVVHPCISQISYQVTDECLTDRRFNLTASVGKFDFLSLDSDIWAILLGLETYESIDMLPTHINLSGDSIRLMFDSIPTGRYVLNIYYQGECSLYDTFYYRPKGPLPNPYQAPTIEYRPAPSHVPCSDHDFAINIHPGDALVKLQAGRVTLKPNTSEVRDNDSFVAWNYETDQKTFNFERPLRDLTSENSYYYVWYGDDCMGNGSELTIPCQVYANVPTPQIKYASDCSTADGQLRFLRGATSHCATGGESWLELRDRTGNIYPESPAGGTKNILYDGLAPQRYKMYVVGVEGCERLVDSFDLSGEDNVDIYTEIEAACPGQANGAIYFDIFTARASATAILDGRPVALLDIGDDAYEARVEQLMGGEHLLEVTAGACTRQFPFTIPVPAEEARFDALYFGGRAQLSFICVGQSWGQVNIPLFDRSTPPYTLTWSDGVEEEMNAPLHRRFDTGGTYTATITDKCGKSGNHTVIVTDQRARPPITVTYGENVEGECLPAHLVYTEDSDNAQILSVSVNGVADVNLTRPYRPRGDSAIVRVEYLYGNCRDTSFRFDLGTTTPLVNTLGTCRGLDNGRIEIKVARPPVVPTLRIGDIPEVPFTGVGDTIFASLDGLPLGEYAYTLTYPGHYQINNYTQLFHGPREKSFVSYDHDELAYEFDLVCHGETLEGFRFKESPIADPDYHAERCRSFLTCGDVRVKEVKGRKRKVKVWFYKDMLEQAYRGC